MANIIVEYVGPKREVQNVPKLSGLIYDVNIGKTKEIFVNWREEEGRIFSQAIDKSLAQQFFQSRQFIEYNKDKKPKIMTIPQTEGNAMLKQKLSQATRDLEMAKRENLSLRQNLGKADIIKTPVNDNVVLKENERENLIPKRGRPKK